MNSADWNNTNKITKLLCAIEYRIIRRALCFYVYEMLSLSGNYCVLLLSLSVLEVITKFQIISVKGYLRADLAHIKDFTEVFFLTSEEITVY